MKKKLVENWKRSLIKSITYRIVIIILDFTIVYLFTRRLDIATGFVIISNIYTTFGYYFHERIWAKIKWGEEEKIVGKKG